MISEGRNISIYMGMLIGAGILFFIWPTLPILVGGKVIQYVDYVPPNWQSSEQSFFILQESYHGAERFVFPISRLFELSQLLTSFILGKAVSSWLWFIAPLVVCFASCSILLVKIVDNIHLGVILGFVLTINPMTLEYLVVWPTAVWYAIPVLLWIFIIALQAELNKTTRIVVSVVAGIQVGPFFAILCLAAWIGLLAFAYRRFSLKSYSRLVIIALLLTANWSLPLLFSVLFSDTKSALPTTDGLLQGMALRNNQINAVMGWIYPMQEMDFISGQSTVKAVWLAMFGFLAIVAGFDAKGRGQLGMRAALLGLTVLGVLASAGPTSALFGDVWKWVISHVPGAQVFRTYTRVFVIVPSCLVALAAFSMKHTSKYLRFARLVCLGLGVCYVGIFGKVYLDTVREFVGFYDPSVSYERLSEIWSPSDRGSSVVLLPNGSYEPFSGLETLRRGADRSSFLNGYFAITMFNRPVVIQGTSLLNMGVNDPSVTALLARDNAITSSERLFEAGLDTLAARYIVVRRNAFERRMPEADSKNVAIRYEDYLRSLNRFQMLYNDSDVSVWEFCCPSSRASALNGVVTRWFRSLYTYRNVSDFYELDRIDLRLKKSPFWLVFYIRQGQRDVEVLGQRCSWAIHELSLCVISQGRDGDSNAMMSWIVPDVAAVRSPVVLVFWPDAFLWLCLTVPLVWAISLVRDEARLLE